MLIQKKVNKRTGKCFNCPTDKKKKEFISKTINGNKVFICPKCGWYNAPSIFTEYKLVKNKVLILGKTK